MTDGTVEAFKQIRQTIIERHATATLMGDAEATKTLNHEFDVVQQILKELHHYHHGLPPYKRQQLGTLDDLGNAKYVFEFEGKGYIFFRVRPRPEPEEGWHRWGPRCRFICGSNWSRPHFTCLRGCWGKQIWYGKMPPAFAFNKLSVIIRKSRPHWKHILGKMVCSILEALTS